MRFEDIEKKIAEKLKTAMPYLKAVQAPGGFSPVFMSSGQMKESLKTLATGFPAVFIAYGGSEFEKLDNLTLQETLGFTVYAAAKNLAGRGQANSTEYGAYRMIEDLLTAFANQDLGLDMEKLAPKRISIVELSGAYAVYTIDFQTRFDRTYAAD